jgi:uncharacterized protein (TIGR02646 family)
MTTQDYRRFRPYIREDFDECCAYCLLHERLAGGAENFELDHFKPKSRYPDLTHVYENIYYSCHPCNNIKRDIWPTDELRAKGYRFVDHCYDDFSTHFTEVDGRWEPLTPAGDYSQERLRLNREHLIKIRRMLVPMLNKLGALPLDWDQPLRQQIAPLIHFISDL